MSGQLAQIFQPLWSSLCNSTPLRSHLDTNERSSALLDQANLVSPGSREENRGSDVNMAGILGRCGEIDQDVITRLEHFRQSDIERQMLIQSLLKKLSDLEQSYRTLRNDYKHEINVRLECEGTIQDLDDKILSLRTQTESQPFVLALIDGDGVIFRQSLLSDCAAGGSQAANELATEIKKYIQENNLLAGHYSIMVQIYANFDGLARKLTQIGVLNAPAEFASFARAFTMNQPLFSFIDVEIFRLFAENTHCKHIIFGGTHDNGYLNILERYKHDKVVAPRLSLLESTPAEPSYRALGLPIISFSKVFRTQPLPLGRCTMPPYSYNGHRPIEKSNAADVFTDSPITCLSNNTTKKIKPVVALAPSTPPTRSINPATATLTPTLEQSHAEPGSPAATASTGSASPENIWQTVGRHKTSDRGVKVVNSFPKTTGPAPKKFVLLNSKNERIDEKFPRLDRQTLVRLNERIKKGNICNRFHLLGYCPDSVNSGHCKFKHGERLSQAEQIALRLKAREHACGRASECMDQDCLLGHHCSRDPCDRRTCRFNDVYHEIDLTVATKLYEDATVEHPPPAD